MGVLQALVIFAEKILILVGKQVEVMYGDDAQNNDHRKEEHQSQGYFGFDFHLHNQLVLFNFTIKGS